MTPDDYVKRHSYYKKAFKKSRWRKAVQRMLNRDPNWRKYIVELQKWIDEL